MLVQNFSIKSSYKPPTKPKSSRADLRETLEFQALKTDEQIGKGWQLTWVIHFWEKGWCHDMSFRLPEQHLRVWFDRREACFFPIAHGQGSLQSLPKHPLQEANPKVTKAIKFIKVNQPVNEWSWNYGISNVQGRADMGLKLYHWIALSSQVWVRWASKPTLQLLTRLCSWTAALCINSTWFCLQFALRSISLWNPGLLCNEMEAIGVSHSTSWKSSFWSSCPDLFSDSIFHHFFVCKNKWWKIKTKSKSILNLWYCWTVLLVFQWTPSSSNVQASVTEWVSDSVIDFEWLLELSNPPTGWAQQESQQTLDNGHLRSYFPWSVGFPVDCFCLIQVWSMLSFWYSCPYSSSFFHHFFIIFMLFLLTASCTLSACFNVQDQIY